MKKRTRFIAALCCFLLAFGHASPTPISHSPVTGKSSFFTNYTWYKDADLIEEVGTWCDINVECNRLSLTFPGYTFSSTFSIGLYQYEYGYHPYLPMVIIYSNL